MQELLIAALARRIGRVRHVAVGAISPIPAAAALLAECRAPGRLRVTILGSQSYYPFTDGGRELFDAVGQGRIDLFFLGCGQVDGGANVNLVGIGDYPAVKVRFPGSFGAAYMYYLVPDVILFRIEHSRRVLVPKVDFVSAPGSSPPELYRRGGPSALVTGKAILAFDRAAGRFRLESVHPGYRVAEVIASTGFDLDRGEGNDIPETPRPSSEEIELIRGPVRARLTETYPEFAARMAAPTR